MRASLITGEVPGSHYSRRAISLFPHESIRLAGRYHTHSNGGSLNLRHAGLLFSITGFFHMAIPPDHFTVPAKRLSIGFFVTLSP